ncbi:MAG: ABC transporter substrate-binding protein [Anaerolineae bacterium]
MKERISRRSLLKVAGIGAAGAALAACAATPAPQVVKETVVVEASPEVVKETVIVEKVVTPVGEVVELSFQHFFQSPELWEPAFKDIFAWIEENLNVKINHIPTPYAEMAPKLLTLIAGGTPPDLTSLGNTVIAEVAMRGVLLPLDERLAVDPPCPLDDIMPSRLVDNTFEGKLYGMPIDQGSDGIYYNKEIFDKAGLAYPDADWTWEQLLDTALALTVDKDGKIATEAGFDAENIQQWGFQYTTSLHRMHNLVTSLSGNEAWFDKEVTKCTMDSVEIVEALQHLIDLRCVHHVCPTAQQAASIADVAGGIFPFGLGYYAMEFTWVGMTSALKLPGVKIGDAWDVVTYPKGKKAVASSSGQGFPIIKDSKHHDEAWAVIKAFVNEPITKMLGQQGAWMPARISMAQYGQPADGIPEHYAEAFIRPVSEYGFSKWWYLPGWAEWDKTISTELNPCWRCERSAKEAVDIFLPKVNEMVASRER